VVVESMAPDESTPGELLLPSLVATVLPKEALLAEVPEVPVVSGTADVPCSGWVVLGAAEDD
jgi:hypothetical protein